MGRNQAFVRRVRGRVIMQTSSEELRRESVQFAAFFQVIRLLVVAKDTLECVALARVGGAALCTERICVIRKLRPGRWAQARSLPTQFSAITHFFSCDVVRRPVVLGVVCRWSELAGEHNTEILRL